MLCFDSLMIWYIISLLSRNVTLRIRTMKDVLGVGCSGLCLVHCLIFPILAANGASFIGLVYLSGESIHLWLSVAMVGIALWAFPSGWRSHKRFLPGLLAVVGAVLMAFALTAPETIEAYWTLASGLIFICGHLTNRHLLTVRVIQ